MIHRTMSILMIAAVMLVTGMISTLVSGGQKMDTILMSAASDMTFEGMLVVKEADGVFIIRSKDGKQKRFKLDKKTMITRNEEPSIYKDLRSRDQVRVHYNSDFVATDIQANGP